MAAALEGGGAMVNSRPAALAAQAAAAMNEAGGFGAAAGSGGSGGSALPGGCGSGGDQQRFDSGGGGISGGSGGGGGSGADVEMQENEEADGTAGASAAVSSLKRKYGNQLLQLVGEFAAKKKPGKLPHGATQVLKSWWDKHYVWPYPAVSRKCRGGSF